jgi:hypothetical protein
VKRAYLGEEDAFLGDLDEEARREAVGA